MISLSHNLRSSLLYPALECAQISGSDETAGAGFVRRSGVSVWQHCYTRVHPTSAALQPVPLCSGVRLAGAAGCGGVVCCATVLITLHQAMEPLEAPRSTIQSQQEPPLHQRTAIWLARILSAGVVVVRDRKPVAAQPFPPSQQRPKPARTSTGGEESGWEKET